MKINADKLYDPCPTSPVVLRGSMRLYDRVIFKSLRLIIIVVVVHLG